MVNHVDYQKALRGHLLDLPNLPPVAWQNKKPDFAIEAGVEYVEEEYLPGPMRRISAANAGAVLEIDPMYVLRVVGVMDDGITSSGTTVKELLAHFAPGTEIVAANGDVLKVRGDVAPFAGQMLLVNGKTQQTVTIPLRVRTSNSN